MLQVPVAVILGLCIMLSGCAAMKAGPSKGAGFVPMEQLAKREDLPFQKVWVKDDVDLKRYKSICITPVNTAHLLKSDWWQQNFRRGQMQEDVATMAQYMQQEFQTAFRNDPYSHFQVVDAPQKGCLVLDLALTELVPSNVALTALEYAPYGGGTAVRLLERATGAESTVAFEARMKDGDTGATMAMFADRQAKKIRIIDIKGFTWYGHGKDIIKEWADQFVKLSNKRPGEVIEGSAAFTLSPW